MSEPARRVPTVSRRAELRLLVLGAVGLLAALSAAFVAGRISGGYSPGAASLLLGLPDPALERAEAQARSLESRLSALEVARRVDQASAAQLAAAQEELQARIEEQAQELTFYRSIVSPGDSAAGLKILRVQILPGSRPQAYRLRIVLIQAPQPATEVDGVLTLRLDAVRAGRAVSLPLAVSGAGPKGDLGYSFRAFQELTTGFDLPADVKPVRLELEARSRGAPAPLRHAVPWKVEGG